MPFVVAATWVAQPGEEQRIESVIRTLTPLSRAEPKNHAYQAHRDPADPRTFFLYEQYTDESGFEDHKATEHFQKHAIGEAFPYLESREARTYWTFEE